MSGIMLAALGGGKAIRLVNKAISWSANFTPSTVTSVNYALNMTWTDAADSNTAFSYSITKKSGSAKLSANGFNRGAVDNGNSLGTSRTPSVSFSVAALDPNEVVSAVFEITAAYAGYQAGVGTLNFTVTED